MALILIFLNLSLGLALEAYGALRGWVWAEPALGVITWAHWGFYLWRKPQLPDVAYTRFGLCLCVLLATFGELVLAGLWGVYEYRSSLLPAYVPPGHGLLFLAGLMVAARVPLRWSMAGPAAAFLYWLFLAPADPLSLPLYFLFLLCCWWGAERRLYGVMFTLALALEIGGTAGGAWAWVSPIPGLSIPGANPPVAAGVFYALLDLLVREGERRRLALAEAKLSVSRFCARFCR